MVVQPEESKQGRRQVKRAAAPDHRTHARQTSNWQSLRLNSTAESNLRRIKILQDVGPWEEVGVKD